MTNQETPVHERVALVWDGGDEIHVPPQMGEPHDKQFTGTVGEQLTEVSCRVCYASVGSGRATEETLANVMAVGHHSTCEHYHVTFEVELADRVPTIDVLQVLVNRPGLFVESPIRPHHLLLTLNPRVALDWVKHSVMRTPLAIELHATLTHVFHRLVPQIVPDAESLPEEGMVETIEVIEPQTDNQKWITLWLAGSRTFSHEQVRHGDFTAISQRSTRYCDESEAEYIWHPLMHAYACSLDDPANLYECIDDVRWTNLLNYNNFVKRLEAWLLERIPEGTPYRKHTARKQARGAARCFLGQALRTEVIFSASVAQWKHMIRMRAADAADAEIREIFVEVLKHLRNSRYGDSFEDLELGPASDGIGLSLIGGGHK